MPPSTAQSICSSSLRRHTCANSKRIQRSFTSTSPAADNIISPESPRFIDVPRPPQQSHKWVKDVKGVLPVPRNIFVTRSKLDKFSPEFLSAATKEPTTQPKTTSSSDRHAAKIAWKARMAAMRRKNLSESVKLLHERKLKLENFYKTRAGMRQGEQRRLISAPDPDYEKYTSVSVTQAVRDFINNPPAPPTEAEVREREENIKRKEMIKDVMRQDSLHTLYQNAREFIVTEAQLSKAIDDAFGSNTNPVGFSKYGGKAARSIWKVGPPPTTSEMLDPSKRVQSTAMEMNAGYSGPAQQRIHKIAEELTGGKI
ncbi:hypothetical protein K490DRAFT_39052 [Saccharata proteae CBS 121410]|uniref:Uncharacterized protein n=1 Tax=Saccharata proteae CBS 121410 TaxID=1314787 RepID=A0A6A5YCW8_9PEZI|nr:hypothetical protein K490DRAFT_39052 [Saccharata proteae CBS 121410]